MSKVLVLSGKKQSGKNSTLNCITGWFLVSLGVIERFSIDEDTGDLQIPVEEGVVCVDPTHPDFQAWMDQTIVKEYNKPISSFIKSYSFADSLKDICINVLGLTWEQCYGSDNDKNTLCGLDWDSMPGYTDHNTGKMTAREVMQYVGTEIFREMSDDCWVDATYRKIEKDKPDLAVIYDGRFTNEIPDGSNKKSIRYERYMFNDAHGSENALNDYKGFDAVINNQDMTLHEKNEETRKVLEGWGWFPEYLLKIKEDN